MSNQPATPVAPAVDIWNTVDNPPEDVNSYFGNAWINPWFAQLEVGMGKRPYTGATDPKTGQPYRKYVAVTVKVTPLAESGLKYDLEREFIAEFGDWKEKVLPSIRELGITEAAKLNNQYVEVAMVPNGTYVDKKSGDTKKSTTMQFLRLFADRDACLAAYQEKFGAAPVPANGGNGGNGAAAQSTSTPPWEADPNDPSRKTALTFAAAFVKTAMAESGNDVMKAREALAPKLASQPLVKNYFTVDSPEIVEAMTKLAA